MKKYEFTDEKHPSNPALRRIRALLDLPSVNIGELGGWIENEHNLSHDGACWVFGNAQVSDNARVVGAVLVSDNAQVFGNARVSGSAMVYGSAKVSGSAWVSGNAWVFGAAQVSGNAQVYGTAQVYGNAKVLDNAQVSGTAGVFDNALVSGDAHVFGSAKFSGSARAFGNAAIESSKDYMTFSGLGSEGRFCTLFRTTDGHRLKVGCWSGTIDQFEERVLGVYGFDSDYLWTLELLRRKAASWT